MFKKDENEKQSPMHPRAETFLEESQYGSNNIGLADF